LLKLDLKDIEDDFNEDDFANDLEALPMNKRASSNTLNKLTNLNKDEVGNKNDFDVILEEEVEELGLQKERKNSIDMEPLAVPLVEGGED